MRIITLIIDDGRCNHSVVEGDRYHNQLSVDEALGCIAHILITGNACFGGLTDEASHRARPYFNEKYDLHPFDHGGVRPVVNGENPPDFIDALRQWKTAEATNDAAELENARTSRDAALARIGGAA